MKKRILALALAGTTAFSVFGAAMSASAYVDPSAQWVSTNDVYKVYSPVAISLTAAAEGVNVKYWADREGIKTEPDTGWRYDSSMSADLTIYPWTTETVYYTEDTGVWSKVITSNYDIKVDQAVEVPTIYLLDYIPANYSATSASSFAKKSSADKAAAMGSGAVWTREEGYGGDYGIRAEVVAEYEAFLDELVLLGTYGDYTLSKEDFKDEYKDQFVSGYYYDDRTGQIDYTRPKWTTDLYNISILLDDIYASSVKSASHGNDYKYLHMNTSELMYLMQQYDKYIGNYIDKAEVEKDPWGDLLVSILENVSEDDFKKPNDYKAFARKAEDLIEAYDDAETSSMIKRAKEEMYELILTAQTKSVGAADEKKALKSDLYSLYFNIGSTVYTYTAKEAVELAVNQTSFTDYGYFADYAYLGNANLTNYAYLEAVTKHAGDFASIALQAKLGADVTSTGFYSLYPATDYAQAYNGCDVYTGNDSVVYDYAGNVTDEYEWFLNVYELANKVNSFANVAGIVSAVNDALNDAVADLEVTKFATGSATTKLDEAITGAEVALDFYVAGNGVNEDDFNATYYAAYEEALAFAEVAEGAAQVSNARAMVEVAAAALGYQGAQTTVSKNDMKTLTAAIDDANAALAAIKNSSNYNAAQVTALNKAIAQAEAIVSIWNAKTAGYNTVNGMAAPYVGDKDGIVKSDLTGAIEAINSAIDYSEIVMGWSKNADGKWLYGTDDGYLADGWNKIGSVWYYFNEDGTAKQSEWYKEGNTWYYFNANAGAARGWCKVDGEWYYFNDGCAMVTGWRKVDGNWYYMAASGKMTTGWVQVDGKWYYMSKDSNSLGQMKYSTTVEGYVLGADGAMIEK